MTPPDFDSETQEEGSRWVLAYGLPDLADDLDLDVDQAVPVALWPGTSIAAVLHIRCDEGDRSEEIVETDVDIFQRIDDRWQASGGGGFGWREDSPLVRADVPPDHVAWHGLVSCGGITAVIGEAGTAARLAEVQQGTAVTRAAIGGPPGAFVVCGASDEPFTVRIYAADGSLLHEHVEPPFEEL